MADLVEGLTGVWLRRDYDLARGLNRLVGGCPVCGEQLPQRGRVGAAAGQAFEDVPQVGFWIHPVVAGADEQAVEHGAAVAGFGTADESSHPEGVSPSGFSQNRT